MIVDYYWVRCIGIGDHYVAVIDDAYTNGVPFGEAFLISRKPSPRLRHYRVSAGVPHAPVSQELLKELGLPGIVRDWAYNELDSDLVEWHRSQPAGYPLPVPVTLNRYDGQLLIRLWVEGTFEAQIRELATITRSRDLQALVHKILWLPKAQPDVSP